MTSSARRSLALLALAPFTLLGIATSTYTLFAYAGEVEKNIEVGIDSHLGSPPTVQGLVLSVGQGSPALHTASPPVPTAARTAAVLSAAGASKAAFEAHLESAEEDVYTWYMAQPSGERDAYYLSAKTLHDWACD